MRLYFVKFEHKESKKVFHKFGITKYTVSGRFNSRVNNSAYYGDRYKYDEFNITEIFNIQGTEKFVKEKESILKQIFPKNFIFETYLNKPYGYFSNGFTGITEAVILIESDVQKAVNMMKNWQKLGR